MENIFDVSALDYLLERLFKGTGLLVDSIHSIPSSGAPYGFVHDIELAHRCLSDALNIVRNEMKDVH